MPKLYGQLKLIAHKGGKKVYDKQVDFDTLDLLTKRFNSKKKYSPLSKMVFDDLNRISDIPIHRTSNKYKKSVQELFIIITQLTYWTDWNCLVDPY